MLELIGLLISVAKATTRDGLQLAVLVLLADQMLINFSLFLCIGEVNTHITVLLYTSFTTVK